MSLVHVFDLGDVLLFVHEDRFFEKLRANCRRGARAEQVFAEHYERARVDRGGDFDSVHPLLVRDLGLTMNPAELRLAWNDIFTPNRPMLDLVRQTPGPRLMLSNTNEPHVTSIRENYPDIFPLFEHCVFSHEVGLRKPDLAIFRHVESLTGRPPQDHVFIDDFPEHVAGARAAGWHAIRFQGPADCRQRLAALAGGE